jgi:hypothetical protein
MGDGSASADLLPEEEVDEDLADDVLDGAVTDAGVEPVVVVRDIGEGVHAPLTKTPCPARARGARARALRWFLAI